MKKYLLFPTILLIIVNFQISGEDIIKDENRIGNAHSSSEDTYYTNPLFEPDLADPTIVRGNDGFFYAYGTENDWSFWDFHLMPVIRSKDLVNWEFVTDVFRTKPKWKSSGWLWAPCIVFRNDTYYLYYSLSTWGDPNPGIGLATASYPYGPFTDRGKVFDSNSIGVGNSIDPFFIETGSGVNKRLYLFWGSFYGIYGIEMADDMMTTKGEKFKIAGNAFEASYIFQKDGKFYFFGSSGSCCDGRNSQYRVTVAVSNTIRGLYSTKDGKYILNSGQEGTPFIKGNATVGWVGPGHNGEIITDDKGRDFFFYHAVSYTNPLLPGGATRRPLMMDEIIWVDGWPTIQNGYPSSTSKRAPYFENSPSAIQQINVQAPAIYASKGTLFVKNNNGKNNLLHVYTTSGLSVISRNIDGDFETTLSQGIYIVELNNNNSVFRTKVIISK